MRKKRRHYAYNDTCMEYKYNNKIRLDCHARVSRAAKQHMPPCQPYKDEWTLQIRKFWLSFSLSSANEKNVTTTTSVSKKRTLHYIRMFVVKGYFF